MEMDWGSIFGSHYKYQQVLMCFVFVFSSFLHEEAAFFYVCFDVTIVVNTKYMLKLNHATRDNEARYLNESEWVS